MRALARVATAGALLTLALPAASVARHADPGTGADRDGDNCDYVDGSVFSGGEIPVVDARSPAGFVVYAGHGGTTDGNVLVAGICVDRPNATGVDGGTFECGAGPDADTNELSDAAGAPDSYCVADGDDDNPDPLDGFVGLSSYEDDPDESKRRLDIFCSGTGTGGQADDTNGGSCLWLGAGPVCHTDDFDPDQPPAEFVCDSDPDNANYDGDEIEIGHPSPICGNVSGNQWEESGHDGCGHE